MRDLFGELRSLLHEDILNVHAFWPLIEAFAISSPQEYESVWLPYMENFPWHFKTPISQVNSIKKLKSMHATLPIGVFHLSCYGKEEDFEDSFYLESVQSIHLAFDSEYIIKILESSYLRNVKTISINLGWRSNNKLYELLRSINFNKIECISIDNTCINEDSAETLTVGHCLKGVRYLGLSDNNLHNNYIEKLSKSSKISDLGTLSIRQNNINDDSIIIMGALPYVLT